ncbi:ECF subfamily RNA polymerase sigma factor, BldN family [Streptomyces lycii]|uniref:Sigma-70 family RNA polymerase sigma factor n=1 Tax=Streptomyces lycii TaxID=2654337 RepID=A0ABQ7FNN7_9ACTN|nr:ECF subfamily RNA polymerase sigma factor, BldN family [Streptomyces lycii]KAF4410544.1 sigma-70 family RNA polymerase sigma factor [Streptomyces lycii]
MYPHVGVDASGLATLRAAVLDRLRGLVPTAYAVPALAAHVPAAVPAPVRPVPAHPVHTARALAAENAAVTRRAPLASGTSGTAGAAGTDKGPARTARHPAAGSDSRRMMDLVERAQQGEADAFGALYDQYADTVYRYIYYRVGSRATAEDLTSETFLRALRRISTFTWQGRDFGAWLVTIARNLVADHFKSSRFRLEVTTGEMLDANEVARSPEDSVLETLSNDTLLDAVRRLNPQQQECVTLRFLQGLSVAETARVMGKNEGAIKTLQYRAVRTLARLLPEDAR